MTGVLVKRGVSAMLVACLGFEHEAIACIWDADSLEDEKKARPTLAQAILDPRTPTVDTASLEARVEALRAAPRESEVTWFNDLGGALLRLGRPAEALPILEDAVTRFPDEYGVHANLGTAYHLAGRFIDAEREIRRGLQINAEGHDGLEKYHLALLQYLIKSDAYRASHVYVDEFSANYQGFAFGHPLHHDQGLLPSLRRPVPRSSEVPAAEDPPPEYRLRWNLAADPKRDDGVIYMATLNPKTPAAIEMLAVVALAHADQNLASAAMERAAALGHVNADKLQRTADGLRAYVVRSGEYAEAPKRRARTVITWGLLALGLGLGLLTFVLVRRARRRRGAPAETEL
jgi:hypothetical protein